MAWALESIAVLSVQFEYRTIVRSALSTSVGRLV
jgi:hypothetical protein